MLFDFAKAKPVSSIVSIRNEVHGKKCQKQHQVHRRASETETQWPHVSFLCSSPDKEDKILISPLNYTAMDGSSGMF